MTWAYEELHDTTYNSLLKSSFPNAKMEGLFFNVNSGYA